MPRRSESKPDEHKPEMSAAAFRFWRDVMGYSREEAAEVLDLSVDTIKNYELGVRGGKPYPVPRTVALACAALFHRIEAWTRVE